MYKRQLVKRGFLREEGKYVISTELGRQFYRALPDAIKKPDVTAEWWLIQENIKDGKARPEDLFKKVLADFETVRRSVGTSRAVSAATADKSAGRKTVGVCPRCGKPVVEGSKGFGCSGYKDGCGFVLWMTGKYGAHKVLGDSGKKVTSAMAEKLLSKGKVLVKGLTSAKGTKYDAWVCMEAVSYTHLSRVSPSFTTGMPRRSSPLTAAPPSSALRRRPRRRSGKQRKLWQRPKPRRSPNRINRQGPATSLWRRTCRLRLHWLRPKNRKRHRCRHPL